MSEIKQMHERTVNAIFWKHYIKTFPHTYQKMDEQKREAIEADIEARERAMSAKEVARNRDMSGRESRRSMQRNSSAGKSSKLQLFQTLHDRRSTAPSSDGGRMSQRDDPHANVFPDYFDQ